MGIIVKKINLTFGYIDFKNPLSVDPCRVTERSKIKPLVLMLGKDI